MVSVAASGSPSCDPRLVSYALEQPEILRSPDCKHKCHAQKQYAATVSCKLLKYIFIILIYILRSRKTQHVSG